MDYFFKLTEDEILIKLKALSEYNSQIAIRGYASEDFIKGLAKVRGTQVGIEYSEVFEVVRLIS